MDDLRKELRLISSSINEEFKSSRKKKRKPDLEKINTLKAKSKPLGRVHMVAQMMHILVQTRDYMMQAPRFWLLPIQ